MTGGVNFMLPQGNMKNVDNIFRKVIPDSRYLGLCNCGWGDEYALKPVAGRAE